MLVVSRVLLKAMNAVTIMSVVNHDTGRHMSNQINTGLKSHLRCSVLKCMIWEIAKILGPEVVDSQGQLNRMGGYKTCFGPDQHMVELLGACSIRQSSSLGKALSRLLNCNIVRMIVYVTAHLPMERIC